MDQFEEILQRYWGYTSFRSVQRQIIESVHGGTDTLALMPTGGGKSITFQVPALAKDGICLVITPLIALMKDQVEQLKRRGIKAEAIHSGLSAREQDILLDNCAYGDIKFLYLSPERLGTDLFRERAKKFNVNLVAIDEAHCISQWGYDFRPSYLKIAELRELLPEGTPFLALTATATPEVVADIQHQLQFRNGRVVQMSFARENLVYLVREAEDKHKMLLKVVRGLPGSGVVYVRSRQKTKDIALMLQQNGISADHYNAGLSMEMRNQKQADWQSGKTRIIVATNAFGMGIDKPDVRFVAHIDLPDSPEAYFQEAGRAGRDLQLAYAVLLFSHSDALRLQQRIDTTFPPPAEIKQVYQALGNHLNVPYGAGRGLSYDFSLMGFCTAHRLNANRALNALKILEQEGYIELTEEVDNPSRLLFITNRHELYKHQVANANADRLIKLILRTYTGVFTQYAKIDEDLLAKQLSTTRNEIYQALVQLDKLHLVDYIPRKRTPMVILTEERLDDQNLRIDPKRYAERRQRFERKATAMLHYAQSNDQCRSQLLLEYFGQTDGPPCGKCDFCTQHSKPLSRSEIDAIVPQIEHALSHTPLPDEALIDSLKLNPTKAIQAIQHLLDTQRIRRNTHGLIEWRK
ncbi:MAG: RecQ family ATP-dependent DNA helicase [Bacteroidales bacterium]|nr:RecQ family ATP-dependent DNA helicase [Bacteroidales bacterium]